MLPVILRLCWKEWRQGWLLLALGLALPPLAVSLHPAHLWALRISPTSIVLLLLLLGVVLRTPTLVAGKRSRLSYAAAHFSLYTGLPACITLLCQGTLVVLIGANVGIWTARIPHALPWASNVLLAICCFLGAFAITLAVTRIFSLPAGLAAGGLGVVRYDRYHLSTTGDAGDLRPFRLRIDTVFSLAQRAIRISGLPAAARTATRFVAAPSIRGDLDRRLHARIRNREEYRLAWE